MKKGILILCAVALLVSVAGAAMADDSYWTVKFRAGWNNNGTTSGNGNLVIGASATTAGTGTAFSASVANIVSKYGSPTATFTNSHRLSAVAGATYTYNVLVAVGTSFVDGTVGPNAGKVWINAWAPEKASGTAGRALPTDYQVRVQGTGVDVTWSYSDLYVGLTEPGTTGTGPVGFWYSYGDKVDSFTNANANDYFTVTVSEVITPEPGSLMALGSGLVGLAGFAIRRRRA